MNFFRHGKERTRLISIKHQWKDSSVRQCPPASKPLTVKELSADDVSVRASSVFGVASAASKGRTLNADTDEGGQNVSSAPNQFNNQLVGMGRTVADDEIPTLVGEVEL